MRPCNQCRKYIKCHHLCSKAEKYTSQDDDEEQWLKIRFTDKIEACGDGKMTDKVSTTEAMLQNYFIDRMKPKEIAERYYKSQQYVYWVIKKYSKVMIHYIKKSIENPTLV
jgi:DNA-directed RNA polymerase specialized sigma subunit